MTQGFQLKQGIQLDLATIISNRIQAIQKAMMENGITRPVRATITNGYHGITIVVNIPPPIK